MPGTELVSRSSQIPERMGNIQRGLYACSWLLKDALVFLNWVVDLVLYESTSGVDLESGSTKGIGHPVIWYSPVCAFRQLVPFDFLFALTSPRIDKRTPKLSERTRVCSFGDSEGFMDLDAIRFRHRLKLMSRGQKNVAKLLTPLSRFRARRKMTGNELGGHFYPPEPRGEDFRKWILVMETLFPNRSTYLGAIRAQHIVLAKGPGPKTGDLSVSKSRSHL
ncbi:hypothetical protein BDN70DRAFT_923394 [Pholiota conissans]|uniref:Uncharacterized protein n=1 Tax=Pholiota conissans TaxID=109636 RepID=A0A9P5YVP3_9AGAR|nr:hypothetical protein BDN70DRAFT_923394 [Pholiota conissans]